jgi:hypothetical protein
MQFWKLIFDTLSVYNTALRNAAFSCIEKKIFTFLAASGGYVLYTRQKPSLRIGDTVRSRWNPTKDWQKDQIHQVLPHRSYKVRFDDGSTRRRILRHVTFSREPPIVMQDDIDPVPSVRGPPRSANVATQPPADHNSFTSTRKNNCC